MSILKNLDNNIEVRDHVNLLLVEDIILLVYFNVQYKTRDFKTSKATLWGLSCSSLITRMLNRVITRTERENAL